MVHENLILYITPEKFLIEPVGNFDELLIIDRTSREISLQHNQGQIPPSATSQSICGIMGTLDLIGGPYLIVITKKSSVGSINGQSIWRIEETDVIPYARTMLHLNEDQVQYNKQYLSMVDAVLTTPYFYFSYTYDLSHTLQRLHNTSPDFVQMPIFQRADQRFIWNSHIMRDFLAQQELQNYWLPVIHGFIAIKQCTINQKSFAWILISRRSVLRAGTRFFMRGLDADGQAANFVETEQIVECDGSKSSFVQTRGSIPLFWNQFPNLKYKPKPTLENLNHLEGFQKHFDNQIYTYGPQIIVNLIDHKGAEDTLEKALAHIVGASGNSNIKYESFDFHHECRHMRWDKLSILINRVHQDLIDMGYFMMLRDGSVPCVQEGVFRTNCIDCLDRTNVVQSLLARESLQLQLTRLGILNKGQNVENQPVFEYVYKNTWADHADILSIEYAGTGALKTDFTRTGKRSKQGLLKDGVNSMIRYFKNNFSDGFRQDSIDLFLGIYQVDEDEGVTKPCPLKEDKALKFSALPIIMLLAISMCFLSFLIPTVLNLETLLFITFWFGMVVVSFIIIMYNGPEFVDYPRLQDVRQTRLKHE
ncbi:phosphatidylinositol-3-phosphatase SAC1-like [Argiope bruennichi]|uniref:Phosphatidylinositol-3-phosphatase SAC1 n=1 Tax=Argiope bruennichi TaxID=94029 RepID=A0A8T0EUE2_ARGBR|nr:phosphatidylinositol-3-phosphatase SAC1-like [Argiope bruennichi]KAF8781883.1 Phosphatidylinositide phosphatase SAC1 like protein [Argiope bruennichi]